MALAGRIVQLACAFITHQQSWRLEQKHRMHPREAVFSPSLSTAGLDRAPATRSCSALWIERAGRADWVADRAAVAARQG